MTVYSICMIELNYVSCNWDSIYMAGGLLISMIITLFILKVSAFSEIYATEEIAVPLFFYVGDKRAVRATIDRILRKRSPYIGKEHFGNRDSQEPAVGECKPTFSRRRRAMATSYATVEELFASYISGPISAISSYRDSISSANDNMIKSYADAQILANSRVRELGEKIIADFTPA
jgi:hypothetical protein